MSDLRKKSAKEKEKELAEKKADSPKSSKKEREKKIKDAEAPLIDESVNVLADWIDLYPGIGLGQTMQAVQSQ